MRRSYIYTITAGVLVGILFAILFSLSNYFLGLWVFCLGGLLFLVYVFVLGRRQPVWILFLLFILGFGLGQVRLATVQSQFFDLTLDPLVGTEIIFTGQVINFPENRPNSKRVVLADVDSETKVLAFVGLYEKVSYGDVLVLSGTLKYPENFITDLGKEFDYVNYLQVRNIDYEIVFPKVISVNAGRGNFLTAFLFALKESFMGKLEALLPEPHSSLAVGILLGVKESMGEELEESFRRTGIIHIVVLSGYNVMIIASSLMKGFSFLPYHFGLTLGAISIFLFAVLVGGGPTVVRAVIMALLALLARATGRLYDVTLALTLACLVMVLHSPMVLIYDVGFQLSFLATLGLIYLPPIFEPYFKFLPSRFGLRELCLATVSAQVAVLPWLLYKIGELSLVSLPVNLLVLPAVPLAMLASFLAGTISFISSVFALPVSYIAFYFLEYMLSIIEWFNHLPVAAIPVSGVSLILALAFYVLMVIFVYRRLKRLTVVVKEKT